MKAAPRTTASTIIMGLVIMISTNLSAAVLFFNLHSPHKIMEVTRRKITSQYGFFETTNGCSIFQCIPLHNHRVIQFDIIVNM